MLYNFNCANIDGFVSCDPAEHCIPGSAEWEMLMSCISSETVVHVMPQSWVWDSELGDKHPAALLAKVYIPDCEETFLCTIRWEDLDRGGFQTPDSILFQGIQVVLSLDEHRGLVGSRKRAQELNAAAMADQRRIDEVYEAIIICRRPDGYTVLVNDHHAHLRDCDIPRSGGRSALLRQQGQKLNVRFSHVFPNGHMFVYSDEKYPSVEEMEFGTYLPCRVLELRDSYVLTALSPGISAVAYYPQLGEVRVGETLAARVTRKVHNEDGSIYIRVKLFPGVSI